MWSELGSYALSAKELMAAFTDEEITCFTSAFNISREQLEALIGSRQPGQSSSAATPCITDDAYGRILVTMLSPQVGGLSRESRSCVQNFALEHPHFMELAMVGTFDASTMSEGEFVEIVEDRLRIYHCMTDDELRTLQKASAHALASFGESAASHAK